MSTRSALLSRYLDSHRTAETESDYKSTSSKRSKGESKKKKKKKKKKHRSSSDGPHLGQNLSIKDEDEPSYVKPNADADTIDVEEDGPVVVESEIPFESKPTRHDSDSEDDENDKNDENDDDGDDSDEGNARRLTRHDSSDEDQPRGRGAGGGAGSASDSDSDLSVRRAGDFGAGPNSDSDSDSDISVPRAAAGGSRAPGAGPKVERDSEGEPRSGRGAGPKVEGSDSDISVPRKAKRAKVSSDTGGLMNKEEYGREMALKAAKSKVTAQEASSEKQSMELGKNAATVYRDSRGRKLGMLTEFMKTQQVAEGKAFAENQLKYEWGTGKVDRDRAKDKKAYFEQVKDEAFARYADNKDLNDDLKNRVRAGDPMANLLSSSKPAVEHSSSESARQLQGERQGGKPKYSGPPAPPNRFGILPGYRWDGIHRGNGHERKLLMKANTHRATAEDRYKWSVSGM